MWVCVYVYTHRNAGVVKIMWKLAVENIFVE